MTDEERAARGYRATSELTETEAAFDAVRAAIVKTLIETSPAQPDKILKLHTAAQTVDAIRQALRSVIDDGQVAQAALAIAGLTRN